jgi:cell division protein FtsL
LSFPRFFYQIESEGGLPLSNLKTQKDFIYYDDYWKYITEKNLEEAQQRYEIESRQRLEKRRLGMALQVIALCACVCLGFSGVVIRNAAIFQAKYEIHVLHSEVRDLQLEMEEIGARIDNTVSLHHVEEVALGELKMQYPQPDQVVHIEANWDYALEDTTDDAQMAVVRKTQAIAAKLN